jgi:PAS domain S-box-containing protein
MAMIVGFLVVVSALLTVGLAWLLVRERQLRARADRAERAHGGLASALAALPFVAVMRVDRTGALVGWNRGCEDLYGWTADQALGRQFPDFASPPEAIDLAKSRLRAWVEDGRAMEPSLRCSITSTSERRQSIGTSVSVVDIDGEAQLLHVAIDVTALRQAEADAIAQAASLAAVVAEKDRMVEELLESDRRFRALLEGIPHVAVQGIDADGRVILWNAASEDLFGRPRGDAMGRPTYEVWPNADMRERHRLWCEEGHVFPFGVRDRMTSGGDIKPILTSSFVYPGRDGRRELYMIGVDLSAERAAQAAAEERAHALTESHAELERMMRILLDNDMRFRTLLENIPHVAIQGIDAQGDTILWNRASETIFGFGLAEVYGRRLHEVWALPETAEAMRAEGLEWTRHSRAPATGVRMRATAGGELKPILTASFLYPTQSGGRELYMVGVDMSEERAARADEQALVNRLTASDQRFRAMLTEVPQVAIQGVDASGAVILWNRASAALFGVTEEEALGRPLHEIWSVPTLVPEMRDRFRDWVDHGRVGPDGVRNRPTRDGTLRPILTSSVIHHAADGGRELYLFGVDLTAERAALERATAASQAKSAFLAAMSHDLRTPLNAICGFTDLMLAGFTGALNDKQRGYLGDIARSSRHLLGLIGTILDLTQIEADRFGIDETWVTPEVLIEDAVAMFKPQAQAKELALTWAIDAALQVEVSADPARIRQVLGNLLTNAVRFTPAGGQVTVAASLDPEGDLKVTVEDSGIGIAAKDLERVRRPFEQVRAGSEVANDGIGLGLTICDRLMALHDGSIAMESERGVGTRVTLNFPRARVRRRAIGAGGQSNRARSSAASMLA